MPNKKDLALEKYNISQYRYRELMNFCKQYPEMKEELADLRGLSGIAQDGMPHGSTVGNPTANKAMRTAELATKVRMIEDTAKQVDPVDWQKLLHNIVYGVSYNTMRDYGKDVHQGKNQFYTRRRIFFYLLDKARR